MKTKSYTDYGWNIHFYIDNEYGYVVFILHSRYDVYEPIAEYIVDSIAIEEPAEPSPTPTPTPTPTPNPEPTKSPLEDIDFVETPFHGMTFEVPSDWIVIDYVESDYSYDVIAVRYADSADPTFICDVYYYDMADADEIETFVEEVVEYAEDNGHDCESTIIKIEGYTVGIITTYYDSNIDTTCFVQTSDGGNLFDFFYPADMEDEMTAIIEYFIDSIDIDN